MIIVLLSYLKNVDELFAYISRHELLLFVSLMSNLFCFYFMDVVVLVL